MVSFLFLHSHKGTVSTVHVTAQNCTSAAAKAREMHPAGRLTFLGVAVMPPEITN